MADEVVFWKVYEHISPSGKIYVGITHHDDPNVRWQNGLGYMKCPFFKPAILKYGWSNFEHKIVAEGLSQADACSLEKKLIKKYKSANKSYNSADGGLGHTGKMSDATRKKISVILKSLHRTPWNKGKVGCYSDETLKKMSDGVKKSMTPEARAKLSATHKGRPGWSKGLKFGPMSQEVKDKISKANKGKNVWSKGSIRGKYSEEHCKHISEGLKGKRKGIQLGPRPECVKAKISESRIGLKWMCRQWEQPKQVHPQNIQTYIEHGWQMGKLLTCDGIVYKWLKTTRTWEVYKTSK